jgi:hypothetical protein
MSKVSATRTAPVPPARLWSGRTLSAIAILFLLMDGGMKVARATPSVSGTVGLGYPDASVAAIGALVLVCTLLYLVPRTATFGALLLTGFLGGAVATQLRVSAPWLTHILFPVYLAAFVWGGLLLRRPAFLHALLSTD